MILFRVQRKILDGIKIQTGTPGSDVPLSKHRMQDWAATVGEDSGSFLRHSLVTPFTVCRDFCHTADLGRLLWRGEDLSVGVGQNLGATGALATG